MITVDSSVATSIAALFSEGQRSTLTDFALGAGGAAAVIALLRFMYQWFAVPTIRRELAKLTERTRELEDGEGSTVKATVNRIDSKVNVTMSELVGEIRGLRMAFNAHLAQSHEDRKHADERFLTLERALADHDHKEYP